MTIETSARTVMEWCDILGSFSEEQGCLTRPFASNAMRRANEAGRPAQRQRLTNVRPHRQK